MAKIKTIFICQECAYETTKWLGRCPSCNTYSSFVEEVVETQKNLTFNPQKSSAPILLNKVAPLSEKRIASNIPELDRVLSGGIVDGSLILVGGDPGIGKSTLLLQLCQNIGMQDFKILYISGEESVQQIKLRAERLNITTDNLYLLAETNMYNIESTISDLNPKLVIVDSIQTVYRDELTSAPGSVTQVRESTALLMKIAKSANISIFLVGHVTKDGNLAGPRVLEHMVDTVLYFEGEKKANYRIVRVVKNRFGGTNEIGVFEMQDKGLVEIPNPSEYMLSGRPLNVSGSAVTCSIEGTRPILTEVQALVSFTNFGQPRRMAAGTDYNRVIMLIAVLEKRIGMQFGEYDSYVNIAGGIKIAEPSLDAAVITSLASSYRNKIIDPYTLIFGEIGLTGEIRAVSLAEKRVQEAQKLGFKQCVLPRENMKGLKKYNDFTIYGVSNVSELLEVCDIF